MRCLSCNKQLNDTEATRKYTNGTFIDLCDHCFDYVADDIPHIEGRGSENNGEIEETFEE